MARRGYRSGLAGDIAAFVEQKRASGHPYDTSAGILGRLDDMVAESFPDATTLTREICDAWVEANAGVSANTLLRRVSPVRQLGKWLVGSGAEAHVIPGGIPSRGPRYEPHIFTEPELRALFASIDACPASDASPTRHYVVPVFFRLLLTCGLRSSEARLLGAGDVDLATGEVRVGGSKGWEGRVVYVADDMLGLMRRYDRLVAAVVPGREAFFPNADGAAYCASTPDVWFHEFWDPLPEAGAVAGNPPRVHDLRHTYCVYRINQWVREGEDVEALQPYLSEFVGHARFADTDYYLHLAEPFWPDLEEMMGDVNERVLPEVPHGRRR